MPLLILLYPFVEIYLLLKLVEETSFLVVLFYLVISGFLGITIMKAAGKKILIPSQSRTFSSDLIDHKLMHRIVIFLGGLFLSVPGIISKIIGCIFVLPGPRHLAILLLREYVQKAISTGALRVFKFGENGAQFSSEFDGQERDVTVVDVQAIDIQKNRIE